MLHFSGRSLRIALFATALLAAAAVPAAAQDPATNIEPDQPIQSGTPGTTPGTSPGTNPGTSPGTNPGGSPGTNPGSPVAGGRGDDKGPGDKGYGDDRDGGKKDDGKGYGDKGYGDKGYGDRKDGDRKDGDKGYGDRKDGDKGYGDRKDGYGDRKDGYGDRKDGSGDRKDGYGGGKRVGRHERDKLGYKLRIGHHSWKGRKHGLTSEVEGHFSVEKWNVWHQGWARDRGLGLTVVTFKHFRKGHDDPRVEVFKVREGKVWTGFKRDGRFEKINVTVCKIIPKHHQKVTHVCRTRYFKKGWH